MPSPNIVFRAVGALAGQLAARTRGDAPVARDLSETARRDLTRYYTALAADLASVRLTSGEALYLCDLLRGTHIDERLLLVRHLRHEILDGQLDGLAEKWGIDAGELAEIVSGWTVGQRLAVVDAAERFRKSVPHDDHEAGLRAIGLTGARE